MVTRFSLLWALFSFSACLLAQSGVPSISVDPTYDAERLVREVFANDRCETIFNVKQIGNNPAGIGYFSGDGEVLGFGRGIVLSTGKVKDAEGPNRSTNTGSQLSGATPDPDLDVLASGNVFDHSGLEFDFIPLESEITFRYVFASEEYCEFVGGAFNDLFGFFVSGPGYNGPYSNGAVNVATVPGTRQAVSINNINYSKNRQYYLDNEHVKTRQEASCGGGTETGPRFQSIEYDGQTVILTATLKVQPCETYHIRLVVADIRDSDLDSAVFLEAGSFDLGSSVSLENEDGSEDGPVIAYEGCKPGIVRVVRGPDSRLDRDQTISYRVTENSVASDSLDFSGGNGTVTIPAGENYAEIEITAFADNLAEGDESAWLVYDVPCACFTDSVQVIIREADTLSLGLGDPFLYCPSEGTKLTADVAGGVPPYTYQWSFGSTEAEPEFKGELPDTIMLTLSDACGAVRTGTAATQPSDPPNITLPEPDLTACWGESIPLPTRLTGSGPFTVSYRQNGGPVETIELEDGIRTPWMISRSGSYQVIGVQDRACASQVNELSELTLYQPAMNVDYTDPTCNDFADGSITIEHLKTVAPYRYFVDEREIGGPVAKDLSAGSYKLRVSDGAGCEDTTRLDLIDPEAIRPVAFTCQDLRRRPIQLSAAGGQAPYQYSVDGLNFSQDLFAELQVGDTYQLTIQDAAGCELRQPDFYYPASGREFVRLQNFYPQEIGKGEQLSPTYFLPPQQILSYSWSPAELFDCPTCPNPTVTAPFTQSVDLVIKDIFGCVDSVATSIAVDGSSPVFVPNVFSPDGDGTNDYLTVFANPDMVTEVVSFRVHTRWGELVFTDSGFPPNSARRGWDGLLGSRVANVGTYLWTVQYRLQDGELMEAAGTTILMPR